MGGSIFGGFYCTPFVFYVSKNRKINLLLIAVTLKIMESSPPASVSSSAAPPRRQLQQTQSTMSRRKGGLSILTPLLRHLSGLEVTVELKNGRSYCGALEGSDDFMNLVLRGVRTLPSEDDMRRGGGRRDGFVRRGGWKREGLLSASSHRHQSRPAPAPSLVGDLRPEPPAQGDLPLWHRGEDLGYEMGMKENLEVEDYELLQIRGPSIRYVQLPDKADLPR